MAIKEVGGSFSDKPPTIQKPKKTTGPKAPAPKYGDNPKDSRYNAYIYALQNGTKGMSKAQIQDVQRYLSVHWGASMAIDGDPKNKYLVQALKKQQPTLASLPQNSDLASSKSTSKTTSTSSSVGSVADLQKLLNSKGAKLVVDGKLGPKTAAAAKQYGVNTASYTGGGSGSSGGSSSGGGGGTSATGTPTNNASADALIQQQYGYLAWALQNPELKSVLEKGAQAGWNGDQLQAAIENTNWWRTTSSSARSFFQLQQEDPASAQQQINSQKDNLRNQAASMGVNIDDASLNSMALTSLQTNWNNQEIRQAIGAQFMYKPGALTGEAAVDEQAVKALAHEYYIPLADSTVGDWTKQILQGNNTSDGFRDYLVTQAKSLFPSIADALDKGVTVAQYVNPYQQIAAKTLELSPDAVDFDDPKFNKALNQIDPKTGQRTSMSLSDFQTMLQSDPTYGYHKTQQARDQAYQLINGLNNTFGVTSSAGSSNL